MSLHLLKLERKLSSSFGEIKQSLKIRKFFASFCQPEQEIWQSV